MNIQLPTSITELDMMIRRSEASLESLPVRLTPFERRFAEVSSAHRQLLCMKRIYGSHPTVDAAYATRRSRQLAGACLPPTMYREGYESIISDISRGLDNAFDNGRVRCFLDLGFSPGGFSNWLLTNNPNASGVGITLPDTQAGYHFIPEGALGMPDRFRPLFDNLITLTQNSLSNGTNPIDPLLSDNGRDCQGFDFILAGAFPTLEGRVPWYHRVQLALSQLYIVFFNLLNDGSAIFVINTKPYKWQVEVLGMLKTCFRSVVTVKGVMHKTRTSCYVVCTGFEKSDRVGNDTITQYQRSLREALITLKDIAEAGDDVSDCELEGDRLGHEAVMPSVSGRNDDDIFDTESQFILDLLEPCWKYQFDAIRNDFKATLEKSAGKGFHLIYNSCR